MTPNLDYALSFAPPSAAERAEMACLHPLPDARWQEKMDFTDILVTVRDCGHLVATGVVHRAVVAPTGAANAVELGAMVVDPRYRRLGIRQHVTALRLHSALRRGGDPITVIDERNLASWAWYERSELWVLEREFEQDSQSKLLYRATSQAWAWASKLPQTRTAGLEGRLPAR